MHTLNLNALTHAHAHRGLLRPPLTPDLDIPYIVVKGQHPGPVLLVTAGIHGAEYASIEAAYQLADTPAAHLRGTLVILPIVNPPSFYARSIYVNPIDGQNLNRMFPGNPGGTYSEQLAHWLTEHFIRHADAYVDLHGGDLIEELTPFTIYPRDHEPSRQLAHAFGIQAVIASDGTGMTYTAGAALGVPSIIAEAGGQGRWPKAEVALLVEGVHRAMHHLGMQEGTVTPANTREYHLFAWTRSEHQGLWRPRVTAGDHVQGGQLLGCVYDPLGRALQEVHAQHDGDVLFGVSSLAINANDPLVGIGVRLDRTG